MADFINLACRNGDGVVHIVVESPRGSRVKLRYDIVTHVFMFDRSLLLGLAYPYDWGFVPSTRAADGDPLDAMVLCDAPTWPGVVIPSWPIGVVRLVQRTKKGPRERNDRIIAVPVNDPRSAHVRDLPKRLRDELEEFFVAVTRLGDKTVTIEGWQGPKAAAAVIEEAAKEYARRGVA